MFTLVWSCLYKQERTDHKQLPLYGEKFPIAMASKTCVRCKLDKHNDQFSVDLSQMGELARVCKSCHSYSCKRTRDKEKSSDARAWYEEDKHYKMPGGMHATGAERLAAFYKESEFVPVCEKRVCRGLQSSYESLLNELHFTANATGAYSLSHQLREDPTLESYLQIAIGK